MPLRVEGGPRLHLGTPQTGTATRRSRGLSDIAPQYVAKSGLNTTTELEGARGTSFRIQHVLKANVPEGTSRFPKLDECAHFHYEHVELDPLQFRLVVDEEVKSLLQNKETTKHWYISIVSQGESWMIRRSYENFRMMDEQLHRCIYDRKFSKLDELPSSPPDNVEDTLTKYLVQLSNIAGSMINCGPVLSWFEMDNRGHRLLVPATDSCPINTPAVAAAYTVKKYTAQAPDELSFEVGDMISVIDMPPPEESIWWRGKRGFLVGFFPCECVAVIGEKIPRHIRLNSAISEPSKSVLRKHGKLIAFFRSFILNRPSRRRLRQSGILRERVFGCDLGEHLQNSGHDVPMVLKCCAEFIETHGIVDGIYRLSGVTSNIHKLRNAFDEDRVPALYEDTAILQDIHSVASLLKMYFRELPNPLCTYQLYHQFVAVVQESCSEDVRLLKMRDVVNKLPPPHYRTLEYLMRHLSRVAQKGGDTGMTPRNLAIVWAPNLLRCREFEVGGVAALQFVGVQAVVTEFLVYYCELIFCPGFPEIPIPETTGLSPKKLRPKSLAISTPTRLLSLEQARTRALIKGSEPDYIEVGGGPASLPLRYHTVIELPSRKRTNSKRSPIGWRMLFGSKIGQKAGENRRKSATPTDISLLRDKALTESDIKSNKRRLRPAKSVESLTSLGAEEGRKMLEISERSSKSNLNDLNSSQKVLLRPAAEGKPSPHSRAISHESYFDLPEHDGDQDTERDVFDSTLDLSEIQVNFDLEESEMRIFSEDETLTGSGSISFNSPRSKLHKSLPVSKRVSNVRLARPEDSLSSSHSADPSPKKFKTQNEEYSGKSQLEERLSSSVGELQFIDSVSPDQTWTLAEVHPIQSPSPVNSLSQFTSSPAPNSPILPHIPHLNRTSDSSDLTTPETPQNYAPLIESPPEMEIPKPEQRKPRPYHPYENICEIQPKVVALPRSKIGEKGDDFEIQLLESSKESEEIEKIPETFVEIPKTMSKHNQKIIGEIKQFPDETQKLKQIVDNSKRAQNLLEVSKDINRFSEDSEDDQQTCEESLYLRSEEIQPNLRDLKGSFEVLHESSDDSKIPEDFEGLKDLNESDIRYELITSDTSTESLSNAVKEDDEEGGVTVTQEISHLILEEDLSTSVDEPTLSEDLIEMETEKPKTSGEEESEPTTESEASSLQTVIYQSCGDITTSTADEKEEKEEKEDLPSEDELNGLSRMFREPVLETSFEVEENLPLRSSSSSNVKALLCRSFEQEKAVQGERPRTLERLSTKKYTESLDLNDPERRERIEQYKEKRRTILREKYRTTSTAATDSTISPLSSPRKYPPFEKPPRKHPPTPTRSSYDAATTASLARSVIRSRWDSDAERQARSLDWDIGTKVNRSPEKKVTSPRRDPKRMTPPYCIKDMTALFEKRDDGKPPKMGGAKQYLSSV